MNQKHAQIIKLRKAGYSYNTIAEMVGLSKNTVTSICRRAGIKVTDIKYTKDQVSFFVCPYCGRLFTNPWSRRIKRFCSDSCRTKWWNMERSQNGYFQAFYRQKTTKDSAQEHQNPLDFSAPLSD